MLYEVITRCKRPLRTSGGDEDGAGVGAGGESGQSGRIKRDAEVAHVRADSAVLGNHREPVRGGYRRVVQRVAERS